MKPAVPKKARNIAAPSLPWTIAQAAILILATLAAYSPVFNNGFIWDDEAYIEDNTQLRSLNGLAEIWFHYNIEPQYYPFTHTTFWIEYHLWDKNPTGYHVDNLLLQMGSALLLWRLLLRLNVPGALIIALIFAVHPVQVESVAWATERKNVLSGFLYFLSLWTYLHTNWGRRTWEADPYPDRKRVIGWGWYAASFGLFCLALLSKSVTSSLPAIILILLWWKRGTVRWRDIWPLVPFFVVGAAMGMLTSYLEKYRVGAIGPEFDWITPLDRLCIAGRAVWFYLYKLIIPLRLTFFYSKWTIDPRLRPWLLLFPLAAAAALVALFFLRRRLGRGPLAAFLFFVVTLFPALGFVTVFPMRYSFVADHFQYLAMIGPVSLAVAAIAGKVSRGVGVGLALPVIGLFCLASNFQADIYHDRITLWNDTIQKNPTCAAAYNNRGVELGKHNETMDQAETDFKKVLDLNANDEMNGGAWVGLGRIQFFRGQYLTAVDCFLKALALFPDSPLPKLREARALPYMVLGATYNTLAMQSSANPQLAHEYRLRAIDAYHNSLQCRPDEHCKTLLTSPLLGEGRIQDTIELCQEILGNDPDNFDARRNLGNAYLDMGQSSQAMNCYQTVLKQDPNNVTAMTSMGTALLMVKKPREAAMYFQAALRIDPNNQLARHYLQAMMSPQNRP